MTALFINLKIDNQTKFDFFKVTLSDIQSLFTEYHIKFRGKFANDCMIFAKELLPSRAKFYQDIQETDWVAATLHMIDNIKSQNIFIYLEDHRLISSSNYLSLVLKEFDEYQLDYLSYSFFKASHLDVNNLLPLNPKNRQKFSEFFLNKKNIKLIRKISPLYYSFSLPSICSKSYFKEILHRENKKFKIYIKKLSSLLSIIFPFPKYLIFINYINFFLSLINTRLCFYSIDTPFNTETINIEMNSFELKNFKSKLKYGVLKNELFANFDDDNNAYGESLIKRGLYPPDTKIELNNEIKNFINYTVELNEEDFYNCTYYSQIHRIRSLPRVRIEVNYGKLHVNYCGKDVILAQGDHQSFYTNLSPIIKCIEKAEVLISVYDECF